MSFEIKRASRTNYKPLIFIWGSTGAGKTETALRIGRGLAGPSGRLIVVDTEGGRAQLPFDRIPGGYEVIDFTPPFTVDRYCEVLTMLEKNATVGVIDSLSHLWSGPDGVLEAHEAILDKMVGNDWSKREAAGYRAWKAPKMELAKFKDRIMRHEIPIIGCFRGEEKLEFVRDHNGKSALVMSATTVPIFEKKLIFEASITFEVFQKDGAGGFIRFPSPWAKVSHADLLKCLPEPDKTQANEDNGAKIAQWCNGPQTALQSTGTPSGHNVTPQAAAAAGQSQPATPPAKAQRQAETPEDRRKRWIDRCVATGGGHASYAEEVFREGGILLPTEPLMEFPLEKVPTTKTEAAAWLEKIAQAAGTSDVPH
jgi:hypothetical protein